MSDFKPGDEVVLQSWRHTPIGTLHWDGNIHAPMIGMRVKLQGRMLSVMGATLWAFSPGRAGVCAWLEEAFTLADASAPPTERNGSPKEVVKEEEKPQWLIAREACIDPATECVKCGAPRSATNPCKYHDEPVAPSPPQGWSFISGS